MNDTAEKKDPRLVTAGLFIYFAFWFGIVLAGVTFDDYRFATTSPFANPDIPVWSLENFSDAAWLAVLEYALLSVAFLFLAAWALNDRRKREALRNFNRVGLRD